MNSTPLAWRDYGFSIATRMNAERCQQCRLCAFSMWPKQPPSDSFLALSYRLHLTDCSEGRNVNTASFLDRDFSLDTASAPGWSWPGPAGAGGQFRRTVARKYGCSDYLSRRPA